MNVIDEMLRNAAHNVEMIIPPSWGQGRTVFGGLSAAILNRAMSNELEDSRPLRVQTTQFIGPLLIDKPFTIVVEHLRDGKNVTQLQARLIQDENIVVQAMAAFGTERESKIEVPAAKIELGSPPKKPNWIPLLPKVVPKFHKYIDLKMDEGGLPFTGKKGSIYEGWMRFSKPPAEITEAHLLTLTDVWPPTTLQLLTWPAPASTLSWNIEFVHPHPAIKPDQWLAYRCSTRQASGGYHHTEACVYSPGGELIAISRQSVTVFD